MVRPILKGYIDVIANDTQVKQHLNEAVKDKLDSIA